jgi:hypothetical protein
MESDQTGRPALPSGGGRDPGPGTAANGQSNPGWQALGPAPTPGRLLPGDDDPVEAGILRLREEAVRTARSEAAAAIPLDGVPPGEAELRERCRSAYQRWRSSERRQLREEMAQTEEVVVSTLGKAALGIDRFERLTNDLGRLRLRVTNRRREVVSELAREKVVRTRGIPTGIYLLAIVFLGLVEFFANAPVFSALLPRDPLSEEQIRLLAEGAMGWTSGFGRVISHIVLKPDAALLAAGLVVFLCVLAHFFGHSLRELVMHGDRNTRRDTVSGRSPAENLVPMVITGIGLALVIGVLYEARIMLGETGQIRYQEDIAQAEELRREAGWRRVDGDLLTANQLTNRAEDLEVAANDLREYAGSMERMSVPILLLNLTLVLCAIAAAYFHRRDARKEQFNEDPFESDRQTLLDSAEQNALEVTELMSGLVRDLRRLRSLAAGDGGQHWSSVIPRLEGVIALYRVEAARLRGVEPETVPAFRVPVALGLPLDEDAAGGMLSPEDYERERMILSARFETVRQRFADEARAS